MSRFLPDRLFVGIESSRLTLVRVTGFWHPTVKDAECFTLPDTHADLLAIELLDQALNSPRWRTSQCHVTVADPLVRYFIAPLPEGARDLREIREAAALRHEELLGDETAAWSVAVDIAPWASHHLGCAVRSAWIENLQRSFRSAKCSLAHITPFGISEFNRNERRIGQRSGWVANLGKDSLWLAFKAGSSWRSSQLHYLPGNQLVCLSAWITQAELRAGLEPRPGRKLWLTGQHAEIPDLPDFAGLSIHRLGRTAWPGHNESWSRIFRVALSPVWPACA